MSISSRIPTALFAFSCVGLSLFCAAQAQGVIVTQAAVGVYDPPSFNEVDTNASGNALGSTATTDVAGFTTLVGNRFAADFGGVLDFEGVTETSVTGYNVNYGVSGSKTLALSTPDTLEQRGFGSLDEVSGTQGLIDSNTSAPGTNFRINIGPITGGVLGESVVQVGVTVLSRDGIAPDVRVTGFFSDGSSAFLADNVAGPGGADDTFFSLIAPDGESITAMEFAWSGSGDNRLAIDDFGFITAPPIPEPNSAALLAAGMVATILARRQRSRR